MALPATRLILRPSWTAVVTEAVLLAVWAFFEAYLVAFTAPPPAVIVMLSPPLPILLGLMIASVKPSVFEVDAAEIRRTLGSLVVKRLSLRDVGSVETKSNPALRLAVLRVRDRRGRIRLSVVSGGRVSVHDVQFLHVAIARRAREHGIPVSPFIELPPELQAPLDTVRTAHGQRPAARSLVRPLLRLSVVLLAPLIFVFALLPVGDPAAVPLYTILLLIGNILVISPKTARFRKRMVALIRRSHVR